MCLAAVSPFFVFPAILLLGAALGMAGYPLEAGPGEHRRSAIADVRRELGDRMHRGDDPRNYWGGLILRSRRHFAEGQTGSFLTADHVIPLRCIGDIVFPDDRHALLLSHFVEDLYSLEITPEKNVYSKQYLPNPLFQFETERHYLKNPGNYRQRLARDGRGNLWFSAASRGSFEFTAILSDRSFYQVSEYAFQEFFPTSEFNVLRCEYGILGFPNQITPLPGGRKYFPTQIVPPALGDSELLFASHRGDLWLSREGGFYRVPATIHGENFSFGDPILVVGLTPGQELTRLLHGDPSGTIFGVAAADSESLASLVMLDNSGKCDLFPIPKLLVARVDDVTSIVSTPDLVALGLAGFLTGHRWKGRGILLFIKKDRRFFFHPLAEESLRYQFLSPKLYLSPKGQLWATGGEGIEVFSIPQLSPPTAKKTGGS